MKPVTGLCITGFRGIPGPLSLDFRSGGAASSVLIYGTNGTGESSIADALEWFQLEKIEWLAREGGGPRTYAHRNTTVDPEVSIVLSDSSLGEAKLTHRLNRVTRPDATGPVAATGASHPRCSGR